jgi:hypothetical protein
MSARLDPLGLVHDALRALGFHAAETLARTDFLDPTARQGAALEVQRWLMLLQDHGTREDLDTLPALLPHDPALAAVLAREHAELDERHREVRQALVSVDDGPAAALPAHGRQLRGAVHRLMASYLLHLDREEREALPVLARHLTDDQLAAMRARLEAAR